MTLIHNKNFFGYFGNANDDLKTQGNYENQKFEKLKSLLTTNTQQPIKTLFFLEQTHSADVFAIDNNTKLLAPLEIRTNNGDAIITNQKNIAIGVATADCLPLFIYDPTNEVIAVIHAGWRGLIAKIITKTIQQMNTTFGSKPEHLEVYLGPSGKVCCYEVQKDFLNHIPDDAEKQKIIVIKENKLFFNAEVASKRELVEAGVLIHLIDTTYHVCTICTPGYCSFRRDKEMAGRQPSVAFLV